MLAMSDCGEEWRHPRQTRVRVAGAQGSPSWSYETVPNSGLMDIDNQGFDDDSYRINIEPHICSSQKQGTQVETSMASMPKQHVALSGCVCSRMMLAVAKVSAISLSPWQSVRVKALSIGRKVYFGRNMRVRASQRRGQDLGRVAE
jgi:hypothetical protein